MDQKTIKKLKILRHRKILSRRPLTDSTEPKNCFFGFF